MVRAAIYARISSDDGTALGVGRQVEDCRNLAADLGWEVIGEFVDNDVSAFSGRQRPAYEAMCAELSDGSVDAVLAYHADRLHRRPIELEQFTETLRAAGVSRVRFVSGGELDPGNGDGLLILRMMAAVAANESASKSRRVKRKLEQNAAEGHPNGGRRPYGFGEDRISHEPAEAEVIEQMAARYLAGESFRSIAQWLNDQDVPTTTGDGRWLSGTVRNILRSGRIAGLREHRGTVTAKGTWEPIISVEAHERIRARMADAAATGRRSPRSYLLTGLVRCGTCGRTIYASRRRDTRRYVCQSGPDHGGCGKNRIHADPLEELVADAVLYRLDGPELAAALAGRAAEDDQAAALAESLAADRAQLDELAAMWADKTISSREWTEARRRIEDRAEAAQRRLARLTRSDALTGAVGTNGELRRRWADLNLTRQAAIVGAIVDRIEITPGVPRAGFDPGRVNIVWRL